MNSNNLFRRNLFPSAAFGTALAALLLLFIDIFQIGSSDLGTPVGVIHFKTGEARRKSIQRAVWSDMSVSFPVYNRDTIWTQDRSEAVILLNDKSEVELGENTMVVLRIDPGRLGIDLTGGSVRAKQEAAGANNVEIRSGGSVVSGKSNDVQVLASAGAVEVNVKQGEAKLRIGDKEEALHAGNRANVEGSGAVQLSSPVPLLALPPDGASFISGFVNFSWKNPEEEMTFELAHDPGFRRLNRRADAARAQVTVELKPGVYYWRLSGKTQRTDSRRLVIREAVKIEAVTPAPGERITAVTKGETLVPFRWTAAGEISGFELVLGTSADLKSARRIPLQPPMITLPLTAGRYFWKVVSRDAAAQETDIADFSVEETQLAFSPEIYFPRRDAEVSDLQLRTEGILFRWSSIPNVSGYEMEIRQRASVVSKSYRADQNSFLVKGDFSAGEYVWRVRALEPGAVFSEYAPFRAIGAVVQGLSPPNGDLIVGADDSVVVPFIWKSSDSGGTFRLLVGRDPSMKELIADRTVGALSERLQLAGEGTFYWHVKSIGKSGVALGQSQQFAFRFFQSPGNAGKLSPAGDASIDMTNKDTLEFSWTAAARATHYRLTLLHAGRKILGQVIAAPRYRLNNLAVLDAGIFEWEIEPLRRVEGQELHGPKARARFQVTLVQPVTPDFRIQGDARLRDKKGGEK